MDHPRDREVVQHRLGGFSGCLLEVRRVHDHSFVRKAATNREQRTRLLHEVDKLRRLALLGRRTGLFRVPTLISVQEVDDGLASYDIEFVPSWQLDAVLPRLDRGEVQLLAGRLHATIRAFSEEPAEQDRSSSSPSSELAFLVEKLEETIGYLDAKASQWTDIRELASEYETRVLSLNLDAAQVSGSASFSHGDLALDNVLLDRSGHLWLVDPLVNSYETYRWDIAKVLQSTLALWRQIKQEDFELDHSRNKIVAHRPESMAVFNATFVELATKNEDAGLITLFLAATMARVAKYARSPRQLIALLLISNDLLDRYASRRCDLDELSDPLRG